MVFTRKYSRKRKTDRFLGYKNLKFCKILQKFLSTLIAFLIQTKNAMCNFDQKFVKTVKHVQFCVFFEQHLY